LEVEDGLTGAKPVALEYLSELQAFDMTGQREKT
jgi:hypothetical protein